MEAAPILKEHSNGSLPGILRKNTLESAVYRELPNILERYQDEIKENYPKTFRNVAGYNLNILAGQKAINPATLLVGSEGTLGIITAAN